MSSPLDAPAGSSSRYRLSLARVAAVVFTVFVLVVAYGSYVDYCVVASSYEATAKIQIDQPRDPMSPDPMRSEIEFMSTPDVLAQIVTDLELDKIWAKRRNLPMDALPMQDALRQLNSMTRIEQVPNTHVIGITVASIVPKEASDLANAVADRYKSMRDLDVKSGRSPVDIISLAEPPEYPSFPDHNLDLRFAIIEGIVLAVAASALLELLLWHQWSKLSPPSHEMAVPQHASAVTSADY